jgi:hypothetical protein
MFKRDEKILADWRRGLRPVVIAERQHVALSVVYAVIREHPHEWDPGAREPGLPPRNPYAPIRLRSGSDF